MNQYISAAIGSGVLGVAMVLVAATSATPWCAFIAAEVAAMVWVLAYCDWWLNDRLVCLGGATPDGARTVSAVGMTIRIEAPSGKPWPDSLDSDYSVNLLLAPGREGISAAEATALHPYGYLIAENDATHSHGLLFTGNPALDSRIDKATGKEIGPTSEALHVEFEGAAIHDLQTVNEIALGLAVVALGLCMTGYGVVLAAILAILAFLLEMLGLFLSPSDAGDPSDAGIPTISTNREDGKGATILGVTGRWVYDAGHIHESGPTAHNEIHPVEQAQVVGAPWNGEWPENIETIINDYRQGYEEANSPTTKKAQSQLSSIWELHPVVDGCATRADIR